MEVYDVPELKKRLNAILEQLKNTLRNLHDTGEYESENLDKALIDIEKGYKKVEYEIYNLDRRDLQNPYAHVEEISNDKHL